MRLAEDDLPSSYDRADDRRIIETEGAGGRKDFTGGSADDALLPLADLGRGKIATDEGVGERAGGGTTVAHPRRRGPQPPPCQGGENQGQGERHRASEHAAETWLARIRVHISSVRGNLSHRPFVDGAGPDCPNPTADPTRTSRTQ